MGAEVTPIHRRPRVVVEWKPAEDRPGSPFAYVVTAEDDIIGIVWSFDSHAEAVAHAKRWAFQNGCIFRDLTKQQ